MSIYSDNKIIALAIDPGFDGFKMVINGNFINQPSAIIESTGKKLNNSIFGSDETTLEFMTFDDEGNQHDYLVGEGAIQYTYFCDTEENLMETQKFKNIDRFSTTQFSAILNAYIMYALSEYSADNKDGFTINDIEKWSIYVGVALPHDSVNKVWDNVRNFLTSFPESTLKYGSTTLKLKLNIPDENTYCESQALAAYKGLGLNEEGEAVPAQIQLLSKWLPCLINDGGYRTEGLAYLDSNFHVLKAESNEKYPMQCIDIKLAEKLTAIIREKGGNKVVNYTEIKSFTSDKSKGLSVETADKKSVIKIDKDRILSIKEQIIQENTAEFVEYIKETFPMAKANSVLNIGGTGAAYHEYLKKLFGEYNEDLEVLLIEPEFNDEKPGKIFTIAIGLYKLLLNFIKTKK